MVEAVPFYHFHLLLPQKFTDSTAFASTSLVAGITKRVLDVSMRSRAVQYTRLLLTIIRFVFYRPVFHVSAIVRE